MVDLADKKGSWKLFLQQPFTQYHIHEYFSVNMTSVFEGSSSGQKKWWHDHKNELEQKIMEIYLHMSGTLTEWQKQNQIVFISHRH